MRIQSIPIVAIALFLFACGAKKKDLSLPPVQTDAVDTSPLDLAVSDSSGAFEFMPVLPEEEVEYDVVKGEQPTLRISFKEFRLAIDSFQVWDPNHRFEQVLEDSAVVDVELGDWMEGRTVYLQPLAKGIFRVFQRYENTVTVSDEGPHCDLLNWKSYFSDWKEVEVANGAFVMLSYDKNERERFVEVDMKELTEAVRKECGDDWAARVDSLNSPTEYPCGVGTSAIHLKIEFTHAQGNVYERYVSFFLPMGC